MTDKRVRPLTEADWFALLKPLEDFAGGTTEGDVVQLRALVKEIRDGMARGIWGAAPTIDKLKDLEEQLLRKKGPVEALFQLMRGFSPETRRTFGSLANELRSELKGTFDARRNQMAAEAEAGKLRSEKIDVTLPGDRPWRGAIHPLTQVEGEMIDIFARLGFTVRLGPEVEHDRYNFELLNFPADHPARDMQDTFYIGANTLLRTHTSPVQVRTMLAEPPPVRIVAPGAVYRRDDDITHSPRFAQLEGLYVDKGVTFVDLKATLEHFCRVCFGGDTKTRMRPSFFPFTEPSAEVDIGCVFCGGKGCRVCKHSGWLEIMGSGMVDPRVFQAIASDPGCEHPEAYADPDLAGWAFGMGIERITMLRHGVNDIRLFYQNDVRFLSQF